jgi:hypothetical protein
MLAWIEGSWLGVTLRDFAWAFPAAEILHFTGLCLLVGALIVIDLRLLGFSRGLPASAIDDLLPLAWIGFSINLVTGFLFFVAAPFFYYPNGPLRIKLVLILFAGANALWFQHALRDEVNQLEAGDEASVRVKVSAGASLALWTGVILFGRFIMY